MTNIIIWSCTGICKNQRNKKLKRRREPSKEELNPRLKISFVEALTELMMQYAQGIQTQPKNEEAQGKEIHQMQGTRQWAELCQKDMASTKTVREESTGRTDTKKTKLYALFTPKFSSCVQLIILQRHRKHKYNQELVMLSKHTSSEISPEERIILHTQSQRINIHQLYNDLRLFMRNVSMNSTTNHTNPKTNTPLKRSTRNPDRLTDNGTLDTFLHRVRLDIMREQKHKQNKSDN